MGYADFGGIDALGWRALSAVSAAARGRRGWDLMGLWGLG